MRQKDGLRFKHENKSRIKWASLFAILLAVIVTLLSIVACYIYGRLDRLSAKATPIVGEIEAPEDKTQKQAVTLFKEIYHQEVINILLIGQDTISGRQGRSDTMILLSFNHKQRSVRLISFMRDILLPVKDYGLDRLNHAYSYGGPDLCLNTINKNFDLDIQKYVVIRLDEMIELIDFIGGINLALSKKEAALYNEKFGRNLKEGLNHMNGQMALFHSRNRTIGSDFERTRRQRDILIAVYNRVFEYVGKENIVQLVNLVNQASEMVSTNMRAWEIIAFADNVYTDRGINISQDCIPVDKTWKPETYAGMSILKTDLKANREYLHSVIDPK